MLTILTKKIIQNVILAHQIWSITIIKESNNSMNVLGIKNSNLMSPEDLVNSTQILLNTISYAKSTNSNK